MNRLFFRLALLALLSGCVNVHVHFPQAEPDKTEAVPAAEPAAPTANPSTPP